MWTGEVGLGLLPPLPGGLGSGNTMLLVSLPFSVPISLLNFAVILWFHGDSPCWEIQTVARFLHLFSLLLGDSGVADQGYI